MDRLLRLASTLEDAVEESDGDVVTSELIEEVAEDNGYERSHLYAAACVTDLEFSLPEPITFRVCAGGCQNWGALDRIEQLLEFREELRFNIQPRNCLDKCQQAPAIVVDTPDGVALIGNATAQAITEAMQDLS